MFDTLETFRKFLMIDTRNPPGDVSKANGFLGEICDTYGIKWSLEGPDDFHKNFLAKIEGSGKKEPIVLLNHIDVVPVEIPKWSRHPFGGEIDEGFIYGRGAIDMKSLGAAELTAMVKLAKSGIKPSRDFYFLGCCDEETGGKSTAWALENISAVSKAGAVINESWPIVRDDSGSIDHIGIAVSEKVYLTIKLTAEGVPSHASVPTDFNPNINIIEAVGKIIEANRKKAPVITPLMKNYFQKTGDRIENLEQALRDPDFKEKFYRNKVHRALVNNTRTPTMISGGVKTNVIPPRCEAVLDCRLLPGTDQDKFLREIREIINDEKVDVSILADWQSSPDSRTDSDVFRAIEEVCENHFPGVSVVPSMPPFTTDSRYFRAKGIDAYGFQPIVVPESDVNLIHGIDERIAVDSYLKCAEMVTELVMKLAKS